jgi:hypothetical protein
VLGSGLDTVTVPNVGISSGLTNWSLVNTSVEGMQVASVGRLIVKTDGKCPIALTLYSLKHLPLGTVFGCMQNRGTTLFMGSHVMKNVGRSPREGSLEVKSKPKLTVIRLPGAKGAVVSRTQP